MKPTAPASQRAEPATASPIFLTAEWRDLIVVNYEIAPQLLQPLVPSGTELDAWNGRTYISLVGFRFINTKVWGLSFPFHQNFEEANLRFYVRRQSGREWRRGVVFIKEIVPRFAIAWLAKAIYNENYAAMPMAQELETNGNGSQQIQYSWGKSRARCVLAVSAETASQALQPATEAEFILEHYWGYSRQRDGSTMEYQVEHVPWRIHRVLDHTVAGNFHLVYGTMFGEILQYQPASVFLAEGSPVTVRKGVRLP